jgi:hypothetical protein
MPFAGTFAGGSAGAESASVSPVLRFFIFGGGAGTASAGADVSTALRFLAGGGGASSPEASAAAFTGLDFRTKGSRCRFIFGRLALSCLAFVAGADEGASASDASSPAAALASFFALALAFMTFCRARFVFTASILAFWDAGKCQATLTAARRAHAFQRALREVSVYRGRIRREH